MDGRNYYKQGWLATGNSQGVVGVTFTSIPANSEPNSERLPLRTNYNLRNHHAKVPLFFKLILFNCIKIFVYFFNAIQFYYDFFYYLNFFFL